MGGFAPHLHPWVLKRTMVVSTSKFDDFRADFLKSEFVGPLGGRGDGQHDVIPGWVAKWGPGEAAGSASYHVWGGLRG